MPPECWALSLGNNCAHMAHGRSAIRLVKVHVAPRSCQRGRIHTNLALPSQLGKRDAPCCARLRQPTVFFAHLLPKNFASENSSNNVVVVVSGATQ